MQQAIILCLWSITVTVTDHSLEFLYSIEMANAKNSETGLNSGHRAVTSTIILALKDMPQV